MPIIRSAKKKLRQDKNRTRINLKARNQVKSAVKAYKRAPTEKLLQKAHSMLDIAAKKNIYHKNKSNRLKSRLTKLLLKPKKSSS